MAGKRNRAVYQLKVTLRGIRPPIWRRILVWEDATLAQLHRVLQMVMGWQDYHLHEFRVGRKTYGVPDLDDERKIIDVKRTRIGDVVQRVGAGFEYVYDFGDYWQHDLLLETIQQPDPDASYPRCIAGERNCPPEDVGGSGGYENYLEALADPEHEEHEDMLAWRGVRRGSIFARSYQPAAPEEVSPRPHESRPRHPATTGYRKPLQAGHDVMGTVSTVRVRCATERANSN